MDLFLVPTISFRLLYGLLILQHSRRKLLWLSVAPRHFAAASGPLACRDQPDPGP
jgi:hypothetical protein